MLKFSGREKEYFHEWHLKNKAKANAQSKRWYESNKLRAHYTTRKLYQRYWLDVITHYSPKVVCQGCGFNDIKALSVDHINGGGFKHVKSFKSRNYGFYMWLRNNNYPEGYQVLCMNCQWLKYPRLNHIFEDNLDLLPREFVERLRKDGRITTYADFVSRKGAR